MINKTNTVFKFSTRFYSGFWTILIIGGFSFINIEACNQPLSDKIEDKNASVTGLSWGEKMAESIMSRNKSAWQIEERKTPKWNYTHGLVALSFIKLAEVTKNEKYYQYAKTYADDLINEKGEILNYEIEEFNIDHINAGKILFPLYKKTKDERYKTAMNTLRRQLEWQPRNTSGGFWHKLRYPWQMWLDGLYMGSPFYAEYAKEFNQPEAFDDIANQFILIAENAKDEKTGLLYHGWDESRVQKWADSETGLSPEFWGRAIGWYSMALVDVLDHFPKDHPKRAQLIENLQQIVSSMSSFQNKDNGMWSQVVNKEGEKDNYFEATVTSMMAYTLFKAVRKGYLDDTYFGIAEKAFKGLIENLIEVTNSGEINLQNCCAVAGLGGDPFRDGSYEYYVNELIRDNDPKGTGPFILASIEYELLKNSK